MVLLKQQLSFLHVFERHRRVEPTSHVEAIQPKTSQQVGQIPTTNEQAMTATAQQIADAIGNKISACPFCYRHAVAHGIENEKSSDIHDRKEVQPNNIVLEESSLNVAPCVDYNGNKQQKRSVGLLIEETPSWFDKLVLATIPKKKLMPQRVYHQSCQSLNNGISGTMEFENAAFEFDTHQQLSRIWNCFDTLVIEYDHEDPWDNALDRQLSAEPDMPDDVWNQ